MDKIREVMLKCIRRKDGNRGGLNTRLRNWVTSLGVTKLFRLGG